MEALRMAVYRWMPPSVAIHICDAVEGERGERCTRRRGLPHLASTGRRREDFAAITLKTLAAPTGGCSSSALDVMPHSICVAACMSGASNRDCRDFTFYLQMLPYLAEEILSSIFDHLADSIFVDNQPDSAVRRDGQIYNQYHTGYDVSLVSRRFLPYGRRLLYSHFDSRVHQRYRDVAPDPNDRTGFLERAHHLTENPHLASLVKECTIELQQPAFDTADVEALGHAFKFCANLDTFSLLEQRFENLQDGEGEDDENWEYDSREASRSKLLNCFSDALKRGVIKLCHLTLTTWRGYGEVVWNMLQNSPTLRTLEISEHLDTLPDEPPPVYLPSLRKLTAIHCHHSFVSAILAAAPGLSTLAWQ
ncbi:hypothetical protein P7C70_g4457, partial [Phenoliferia sp. Uapishka_3]